MKEYNHQYIEKKWQKYWHENHTYKIANESEKPKYYVLDMFPYPSGSGLHIGHPLGYTASDIVSRYKRLKGFHVLHPIGFDSFGLPAEQYAIDTGQHPAVTTAKNIKTFKSQLHRLGFSYDWSREVQTSDTKFYKWTQWIFMQLFNAWYNKDSDKAEPIKKLISCFESEGNAKVNAVCKEKMSIFSAKKWKNFTEKEQRKILLDYRLTYLDDTMVNWCPALCTVLANDEVKDGYSERGGHPVERKKMRQWMMRITAYANRLEKNLEKLNWSGFIKEMQSNWIGRSEGCELNFKVADENIILKIFTTRPDTIFGVTYLAIAPEHKLALDLTVNERKNVINDYINKVKNRSERDRIADVESVSGISTGRYVINPISRKKIPLWISDYVLENYGTGIIMGVPSSDDRDYRFAKHFNLPIIPIIEGTENLIDPTELKHGKIINSDFLNGMDSHKAIEEVIRKIEKMGVGNKKVNYKMRDAVFSRQRYWGEPVPIYYRDSIAYLIEESDLPLELPPTDNYKPTSTGEPPLARIKEWKYLGKYDYEHTTMPGWAGSSWYFLRYMDAGNSDVFVQKQIASYWNEVDLYVGGIEHATGHLLYSRFWNMFLYDMGFIDHEEPFKRLVNQGMIQGRSSLVYKMQNENKFVSHGLIKNYDVSVMRVDTNIVKNDILDMKAFKQWRPEYAKAKFVLEEGLYYCGYLIEKMSKTKYNTVNPNNIVEKYGADTLRVYQMFLGPLEQTKPWDTNGIEGIARFLKKFWRLFYKEDGDFLVKEQEPTEAELQILHKTIKKVASDIERLSFNTAISALMICVNKLKALKCSKKLILKDLLIILSPFAPHICEELWEKIGNKKSITQAHFPTWNEKYVRENTYQYPISVNGKVKEKITFPLHINQRTMEKEILSSQRIQKYLQGKTPKKIIIVPKKIVNIVI